MGAGTRGTFAVLVSAIVVVLGACSTGGAGAPSSSPSPASTEQTAAEACHIVFVALTDLNTELNASLQELQTNPAGVVPLLTQVTHEFDAAIADVSNEQILAVTDPASASLNAFVTTVGDYAANPTADTTQFMAAATTMQSDLAAIDDTCSEVTGG